MIGGSRGECWESGALMGEREWAKGEGGVVVRGEAGL